MGVLLSTCTTGRDNNFNLMRFIAASLVLFSHSFALIAGTGEAGPLFGIIGMTSGGIAVDLFFITSGFLITCSYFSRNNLLAFVWARVLRIYPALIVATLFSVFVVGLYFTTYSAQEYLLNAQTLQYFVKSITLFFGVDFSLPGVFLDVPYSSVVNASLWTLPYEVRIYAILTIFLLFITYASKRVAFINAKNTILLIAVVSVGLNIFNNLQVDPPVQFIRLFSLFFVGAAFYLWRDKIRLPSKLIYFGLPLLLLSAMNQTLFFVVYSLLLPFIIFYVAYVPSGGVRKFNKLGDYSYGIYIYAFPVQQSLLVIMPDISVPLMIVSSFLITLFLSVLSWHLIEKRCLKMKGSYALIQSFMQNIGLMRRFTRTK
ncbi:MAG: acyltransferase [Gammaproteobacteria bacterium]|nr:acyltransferase [Gammaproteobacteria bacterium]